MFHFKLNKDSMIRLEDFYELTKTTDNLYVRIFKLDENSYYLNINGIGVIKQNTLEEFNNNLSVYFKYILNQCKIIDEENINRLYLELVFTGRDKYLSFELDESEYKEDEVIKFKLKYGG